MRADLIDFLVTVHWAGIVVVCAGIGVGGWAVIECLIGCGSRR